ncbi:transmembrane and death domain protein 1-like [Acipenser ruthenus]|uniref:transmembrane and death domain protein 1-like n=1 Tax=Acipenser ruthenus TaxID=7906 RepID=UPI002741325B|nr:transmembrane and death domain protein 1-like [Acipenser ruthenus]
MSVIERILYHTIPIRCVSTVGDDIGLHQMGRISDLLAPTECQELHQVLTNPEENILEEVDRMSKQNSNLDINEKRKKRSITTPAECTRIMKEWLASVGNSMYYDRLARALRKIGRSDVSREMGKNINQDKSLGMKKYVEDFQKGVKAMQSSMIAPDSHKSADKLRRERELLETNWADLELIIERQQLPPYPRKLFDGIRPLIYGIFYGFSGAFLIGGIAIFFSIRITEQDFEELLMRSASRKKPCRSQRLHHPAELPSSSDEDKSEDHEREPPKGRKPAKRFRDYFPAFNLGKTNTGKNKV